MPTFSEQWQWRQWLGPSSCETLWKSSVGTGASTSSSHVTVSTAGFSSQVLSAWWHLPPPTRDSKYSPSASETQGVFVTSSPMGMISCLIWKIRARCLPGRAVCVAATRFSWLFVASRSPSVWATRTRLGDCWSLTEMINYGASRHSCFPLLSSLGLLSLPPFSSPLCASHPPPPHCPPPRLSHSCGFSYEILGHNTRKKVFSYHGSFPAVGADTKAKHCKDAERLENVHFLSRRSPPTSPGSLSPNCPSSRNTKWLHCLEIEVQNVSRSFSLARGACVGFFTLFTECVRSSKNSHHFSSNRM